jgi:hypothetical protein
MPIAPVFGRGHFSLSGRVCAIGLADRRFSWGLRFSRRLLPSFAQQKDISLIEGFNDERLARLRIINVLAYSVHDFPPLALR